MASGRLHPADFHCGDGVLITFARSELVTQNSERKDIQATMSLIRDELKSNRENYKSIVSEFREDELSFQLIGGA